MFMYVVGAILGKESKNEKSVICSDEFCCTTYVLEDHKYSEFELIQKT